jgi:DNA polymerase-3 subunit gamma/tau
MEVSSAIRERYKIQSKATGIDYLLSGLSLLNKADVQYKSSRNQRLLVELALLQLCSLHDNSGAEKKSDVISIIAAPEQKSAKLSAKIETPPSEVHEAKADYSKIKEPEKTIASPAAVNRINIPSPASPPSKVTKGKMLSIAELTNGTAQNASKIIKKDNAKAPVEDVALSLENAWIAFAEDLKSKKKINLASTLIARVPTIENESSILFSVLNQVQGDEINAVKTDLLGFLKIAMKVPSLQLTIVVDKSAIERKPYTGEEKYQRLAEKNPAIATLREKFNLEIDY